MFTNIAEPTFCKFQKLTQLMRQSGIFCHQTLCEILQPETLVGFFNLRIFTYNSPKIKDTTVVMK